MKKNISRGKTESGNLSRKTPAKGGEGSFFKPAAIQRKKTIQAPPLVKSKTPAVQNGEQVQKAMQSTGQPLDPALKMPLSAFLGENLDHVRIHDHTDSGQAAESLQAKAFTIGSQIHIGPSGKALNAKAREELLTHEVVHTVQQKNMNPLVQAKMQVSEPADMHEQNAGSIAGDFTKFQSGGYQSPGLAIRNRQRILPVHEPVVHRDIKDSKVLTNGKMELDFTKNDATAAGSNADEQGWVKFHPNNTAPESDEIRLIQVVRMIDTTGVSTTAGDPWKFTSAGNKFRNNTQTAKDTSKGIDAGYHVDILPGGATPRTKKSDAVVVPYYNAYATGATGKRKGTTKVSATLWDGPGHSSPIKYNFITSAKGADNGVWYGTALWGFEIYSDKGVAKIKDEYKSFQEAQGATTDAALVKFDEYFKNPGTAGAPTK